MKPRIISFLPAVIWLIIIFVLLILPGSDLPEVSIVNFDKLVHIGLFSVLVFLFSFPNRNVIKINSPVYIVIAISALVFGILMEFVQKYYIPGRSYDVLDMLADGIGCSIGFLFTKLILRNKL